MIYHDRRSRLLVPTRMPRDRVGNRSCGPRPTATMPHVRRGSSGRPHRRAGHRAAALGRGQGLAPGHPHVELSDAPGSYATAEDAAQS